MAEACQLERSTRLGARLTRGIAVCLALLVCVGLFSRGVAGGSSETAGEGTTQPSAQLPERDPNVCRSDPAMGPEMVVIEGGRFRMGSLER